MEIEEQNKPKARREKITKINVEDNENEYKKNQAKSIKPSYFFLRTNKMMNLYWDQQNKTETTHQEFLKAVAHRY